MCWGGRRFRIILMRHECTQRSGREEIIACTHPRGRGHDAVEGIHPVCFLLSVLSTAVHGLYVTTNVGPRQFRAGRSERGRLGACVCAEAKTSHKADGRASRARRKVAAPQSRFFIWAFRFSGLRGKFRLTAPRACYACRTPASRSAAARSSPERLRRNRS